MVNLCKNTRLRRNLPFSPAQPSQITWKRDYVICKYETTVHIYLLGWSSGSPCLLYDASHVISGSTPGFILLVTSLQLPLQLRDLVNRLKALSPNPVRRQALRLLSTAFPLPGPTTERVSWSSINGCWLTLKCEWIKWVRLPLLCLLWCWCCYWQAGVILR